MSENTSAPKHSYKKYSVLKSRYIVMLKPFIYGFKEKESFYSKKGRKLCTFFSFCFQARIDLALVKFHNAGKHV